MTSSAWTEERIGRLKTLWRDGYTAEKIARELAHGITRSAVLGKVYRLGLSSGRSSPAPRSAVAKPKPIFARAAAHQARPPRDVRVENPVAMVSGLATILSVRRCDCRWPFGEPGAADFSLCGRPIERGAFCGTHAAIAYRPAPDTASSLERFARQN
jgi:GcrA cell cycle regulator